MTRENFHHWAVLLFKWTGGLLVVLYLFWTLSLLVLRFVNPPTTGVQLQRYLEARLTGVPYRKRYKFVPLRQISPELIHAVIAAEDGHFYVHHGIDWGQVYEVAHERKLANVATRGASTITQQLVKNLFFTTHRNPVRKAFEYTLAPLADFILGKQRVLELYLNVIEWGPGVYGAQAAAAYHYHTVPGRLDREQAARLAACVPAPRRRRPAYMNQYSEIIMERMQLLGW